MAVKGLINALQMENRKYTCGHFLKQLEQLVLSIINQLRPLHDKLAQ